MGMPEDQAGLTIKFKPEQIVRFKYRNWQGVVALRTVRVICLTFGATEWHKEPQWLLEAFDKEKNAVRFFALRDIVPAN